MTAAAALDQEAGWVEICRRLGQGVRLYRAGHLRSEDESVELSAGTRPVAKSDAVHGDYEEGSRVPREPWRRATAGELAWLSAAGSGPTDMGRSICILRLDHSSCGPRTAPSKRRIVASLSEFCQLGEPLRCIGHNTNPPGLVTTTVDTRNNKFIGMHVDNWDAAPLAQRDRAINRVSMNIGRQPRFFLFLPLSIMEIASVMHGASRSGAEPSADHTALGRRFMERFPDFPIVRYRLMPSDAYIAPTENLVHDGSSAGQDETDEHFTILGHIRLKIASTRRSADIAIGSHVPDVIAPEGGRAHSPR
jgi:hypothetical protein